MNRKSTMEELNRLSVEEFRLAKKIPVELVLNDIRSLQNIGSIFRTADAYRVAHIHLCGITAQPPHRDIHKTALGATEAVDWTYAERVEEQCAALKKKGFSLFALEQTTASIDLASWKAEGVQKLALVIGNEVNGVNEEVLSLCDGSLEIAQFGTKHSLNVAVSTGIALNTVFQILKPLRH